MSDSETIVHNVLLTGGLGYIGSHIALQILNFDSSDYDNITKFRLFIIDNLSNSDETMIEKLSKIGSFDFQKFDIVKATESEWDELFDPNKRKFDCIIHCAGVKSVEESMNDPLKYYETNVAGTLNLLKQVEKHQIKHFIFSSSASVYGNNMKHSGGFSESDDPNPTNPYGRSKMMAEIILKDFANSSMMNKDGSVVCLRYFNPIGCAASIGERINEDQKNIVPVLIQKFKTNSIFNIYGTDWPTPDGTAQRDYIHVVDLAKHHVDVMLSLFSVESLGFKILNLGTGRATSVKEIVDVFNECLQKNGYPSVNVKNCPRRKGDVAVVYANVDKSRHWIDAWQFFSIHDAIDDSLSQIVNSKIQM